MNEKIAKLDRYLITQKTRLESGDILTVKLDDGVLTIFKEDDEKNKEKKTITLIEKFDAELDIAIKDLIPASDQGDMR